MKETIEKIHVLFAEELRLKRECSRVGNYYQSEIHKSKAFAYLKSLELLYDLRDSKINTNIDSLLLGKMQQMYKEQKYIYDECDEYEENTIYQHGILKGIGRILKTIDRSHNNEH